MRGGRSGKERDERRRAVEGRKEGRRVVEKEWRRKEGYQEGGKDTILPCCKSSNCCKCSITFLWCNQVTGGTNSILPSAEV